MKNICKCGKIRKKIQKFINFPDKESIDNLDKMLNELCPKCEPVEVCENIKEGEFWKDEEWRKKELKKMERNIKAAAKRQGEAEIRKFNEYLKSGRRTY